MNIINPTITVQNLEGDAWLCSIEHQNQKTGERILLAMQVTKDPAHGPAELYELVLQQAAAHIGRLIARNALTGKKQPIDRSGW